jgi:hypothetical protein
MSAQKAALFAHHGNNYWRSTEITIRKVDACIDSGCIYSSKRKVLLQQHDLLCLSVLQLVCGLLSGMFSSIQPF